MQRNPASGSQNNKPRLPWHLSRWLHPWISICAPPPTARVACSLRHLKQSREITGILSATQYCGLSVREMQFLCAWGSSWGTSHWIHFCSQWVTAAHWRGTVWKSTFYPSPLLGWILPASSICQFILSAQYRMSFGYHSVIEIATPSLSV